MMTNNSLADITAIILAYNEEKHIQRCIQSLKFHIKRIVVIDNYSTDNTLSILKKNNIEVFQNKFINYAIQFTWGMNISEIKTKWILRIDSDEYLTKEFAATISDKLNALASNISGVSINRRNIFLGKEIKFGGTFPQKIVRIWKNGKGKINDVWCDENVLVDGKIEYINQDIIDNRLIDLNSWIAKHKEFANRETINFFTHFQNNTRIDNKSFDKSKSEKRRYFLKHNVYYKAPVILRPLLYFVYRYFLLFGFLDGWQGLKYHYLQGFWYRFLVDLKILRIKKIMKKNKLSLSQAIKSEFNYDIEKIMKI